MRLGPPSNRILKGLAPESCNKSGQIRAIPELTIPLQRDSQNPTQLRNSLASLLY
jgi:hypothetical protein